MNFNEVYASLLSRSTSAGVGLNGLHRLLERLGNPHEKFKIIHVAGTNGKGSVCSLLARTLTCAGHATGLFVSPHISCPTERISVDGSPISKQTFCRLVSGILLAEEKLNFFEVLTVAAFLYFARKKVEYVVLETGLGGRKDPTNVCNPLVSVITSIGLDHTQLLGSTLEKIAFEKAGIIKKKIPVFCGSLPVSAQRVIRNEAHIKNAPLTFVKEGEPLSLLHIDWHTKKLILSDGKKKWPLNLLGEKQPQNACLVYQICEHLKLPARAVKKAFQTVSVAGRFELIQTKKTTWILDGAHNGQAVQNLISFYKKSPFYPRATLLCGFMKDKNYQKMLTLLLPHFERVIVTVPPSERAARKTDFDRLPSPKIKFVSRLAAAVNQADSAPAVVCCGSFYLVGVVRKKIV